MKVAVVGAGIGGLVSALSLAIEGRDVQVFDKEPGPGGKARRLDLAGNAIDAGPTVFTMRDVFDELFDRAGTRLEDHVSLQQADVLARHAWDEDGYLDLFADPTRSEQAIGEFAGSEAAAGFRSFSREAARAYAVLDNSFMRASKPATPFSLVARIGFSQLSDQLAIHPFSSLWNVLGKHFKDQRLRQLFARYATYCGSSPFAAPGTLSLIAHVEQRGVWLIEGGIPALAAALRSVAEARGVRFRFDCGIEQVLVKNARPTGLRLEGGEEIACDAVIVNADPSALASGLLGSASRRAARPVARHKRSLSALVWLAHGKTSGFPLVRHNVFFSPDYPREFAEIAQDRTPSDPSVYICAMDRGAQPHPPDPTVRERMQIIVNAPADGDTHTYSSKEMDQCTQAMMDSVSRCGLRLESPLPHRLLTPNTFEAFSPSTGGAIYGRASHGWAASFQRQGSRTKIPWLYCAGGSTHPGAGVPMAALSGLQAARSLMEDRASTRRFHPADTGGGMSTRSARTASTL